MVDLVSLHQSIIDGNAKAARKLTEDAVGEQTPAPEILHQYLIPGIRHVGELFGRGEAFLPELLLSGKAMNAAMEILEPVLSQGDNPPAGRYAIGTVKGDLHDIGKNIVIMMLKSNGWEVTDLGVDVSPDDFCQAVTEGGYDILGLSALLTTTMNAAEQTIHALEEAGIRDTIKVVVGGAPTTRAWAKKIGADAHAEDAAEAVTVAASLKRN